VDQAVLAGDLTAVELIRLTPNADRLPSALKRCSRSHEDHRERPSGATAKATMSRSGKDLTRVVSEGIGSRFGSNGSGIRCTSAAARRSGDGGESRVARMDIRVGRFGCLRSVGD
jgi:hypothetical protein